MSETYTTPMYTMPMQPAGDGYNNTWNNNPFAYLIWIYALRWMGFGNGEYGYGAGSQVSTLNSTQLDAIREGVGKIQSDVQSGNSNGMRFLEQIANETRSIGNGITNGVYDISNRLGDVKTAVLNQLSNMQWQISNDTASVVNAINSCACGLTSKIDGLSCGIEKEILQQTNTPQGQMAANQASTQQGFSQIGNGLSSLGYAMAQNDCALRQLISSEGCATRQLMRDLHTEDIIPTKYATISALQGKVYDYGQANLASTIIAALKTTSSS